MKQGNFSITKFYERRARRIIPPLLVVILVCIPFSLVLLWPSDMKEFSQSLIAAPLFVSNILFKRESGYFDSDADFKPLLHTWSLAVEEQYYIFFPIVLILLWKRKKSTITIVLGILFIASFSLAQWSAYFKPAAGFYLLTTRAWELLPGTFTAFYLQISERRKFSRNLCETAGWTGIALIFFAVLNYSKITPYPSFYTLAPTLGTVLIIIFATHDTLIAQFIGNKFFVRIGLISYSAYLWHQPLLAFARHKEISFQNNFVFYFNNI